jgi:hypothetical protein
LARPRARAAGRLPPFALPAAFFFAGAFVLHTDPSTPVIRS